MSIVLFEGMDGSGKSTLVKEVAEALDAKGKTVRIQPFPSKDGPVGQFIREAIFTGEVVVDERAMLHLMVADALDLDAKVLKWNSEYDFVLLDRHSIISAWAYQLGSHTPAAVASVASPDLFMALPEAIFVLDVPETVAMERREARSDEANPLYEKDLEATHALRSRYLAVQAIFAMNAPIMIVDATMSLEVLTSSIVAHLLEQQREAA
jgi:dTMP kinase